MQNNEFVNLMPGHENKWTLSYSNSKFSGRVDSPHGKLVGTYYWVERNYNRRYKLICSEFDQTSGSFQRENISTFS